MDQQDSYGKNKKRIVFSDTDHRHAQLILRLKHDGLKQSAFFRNIITGYLEGDERILDFVAEMAGLSKQRKSKNRRLIEQGNENLHDLGLAKEQIEDIFDLIAEEHPDL